VGVLYDVSVYGVEREGVRPKTRDGLRRAVVVEVVGRRTPQHVIQYCQLVLYSVAGMGDRDAIVLVSTGDRGRRPYCSLYTS